MTDKLVPENLVMESILDDQQAKMTPPIGRIHVDDHILVPGNDTDMAHGLQTTPYRALVYAITEGKLGKGLLAFNIFTDKQLIVNTEATNELTVAGLTFTALLATTETVLYGKTATTIKANFLPYYINRAKILNIRQIHPFHHYICILGRNSRYRTTMPATRILLTVLW